VQWRLESANPIQQGFTQANRSRRISPTISMLLERAAFTECYAHDTTGYGVVSVGLSQAGRTLQYCERVVPFESILRQLHVEKCEIENPKSSRQ
jgi:hypothetical protein